MDLRGDEDVAELGLAEVRRRMGFCPRCGHGTTAGNGARAMCGSCGHDRQVGAAATATPRPGGDYLGAAVVPVARIRAFLDGPQSAADRAAARRFLDSLADPR